MIRPLKNRMVVLGCVTVFAGLLTSSPASATTGYGWDGVYPVGTTCATDAHNPKAAPAKTIYTPSGKPVGKIELRYSLKCSTAWARITNYYTAVPGDQHSGYGKIVRNNDGKYMGCYTPAGTNQYCVTKMLYDKDPLTSYAYGEIDMYPDQYGWAKNRTLSY